jgi:acyl-ACP thioesterase
MKVATSRLIGLFEVDDDFVLRPRYLINCLQEAASFHSRQAGHATADLLKKQKAWVLYRLAIKIDSPPLYGSKLETITWHKGSRAFRSYRDFEIRQAGKKIVSASSLWLYIDLSKKKILKVPKDVSGSYTVEDQSALDIDMDKWKFAAPVKNPPDLSMSVAVRPSDYDPVGHVNNAVYLDYVETLAQPLLKNGRKINFIAIQYNKEIAQNTPEVEASLNKNENGFTFEIRTADEIHAAGQFSLSPAHSQDPI